MITQMYCKDFDDPVCPKPSCKTYTSIGDFPEYCDDHYCEKFIPPIHYGQLGENYIIQLETCGGVCSTSRLGPADTGKYTEQCIT